MDTTEIRYRTWHCGLPPQPIKIKMPGWAGDSKDHSDGAKPQPWHCMPFLEGSCYGLELLYPFNTECHVANVDGETVFEGNWEADIPPGVKWPPFKTFAPGHYGFTSSIDIVGPTGYIIRVESHPSYYTDETWTTPCVVPGHIQTEWWTRIFFVVFKIPPPGQVHIFKKHQPYCQILVLPKKVSYDIGPMDHEEALERANLEHFITNTDQYLAENIWTDHLGNKFSDKYKVIARVFNQDGYAGVKKFVKDQVNKKHREIEAKTAAIPGRIKQILENEELQNKNKE